MLVDVLAVVDKSTLIDARPDTIVRTARPAYEKGTRLLVLHKVGLRDATVVTWLGGPAAESTPLGGKHHIRYVRSQTGDKSAGGEAQGGTGERGEEEGEAAEEEERDLNEFNHAVQRFASAAEYERVRV